MALLRWDPWGELAALQRDMNDVFSRMSGPPGTRPAGLIPPLDAYRTDEALVVRMELPGMTPSDVDISVQEGVLTVSGERLGPADVADEMWVRRERPTGMFERSLSLPEGTEADKIQARFADGVLELHIPHPPAQKPHRVQITASGQDQGEGGQTVDVG